MSADFWFGAFLGAVVLFAVLGALASLYNRNPRCILCDKVMVDNAIRQWAAVDVHFPNKGAARLSKALCKPCYEKLAGTVGGR